MAPMAITPAMTSFDSTRFEQLKASGDLPSPKGVALAIVRLSQRSDVSMAELARVVKADPAFVGRLLKAANTGVTAGRRPIVSAQDALLVLGLPAVRTLALGFSLLSQYRSGACANFDYDGFWAGSLMTALAMQELARKARFAQSEEAFSVGLLSRIGELALATLYPDQYSQVLGVFSAERGTRLAELEHHAFAIDHCVLTAAMQSDWGLPKIFIDVVFHAESGDEDVFPQGSRPWLMAQALAVARQLATVCLAPETSRSVHMPRLLLLGSRLEIDANELSALSDRLVKDWHEWGTMLEVKTCQIPSFEELAQGSSGALVATPEEEARDRESDADRLRILVVDDDRAFRAFVRALLVKDGHEVIEAADGREALDMAIQFEPQVVVADWLMPEMNGIEMTRALRQTRVGRSIYVFLLTSLSDEERLVEAFENGVDDFIGKPLNPRLLRARLRAGQRVIRLQREIERDREEMRRFAAELAVTNRRLHEAALTDSLTGSPNRRHAMDRMAQEWAGALRAGRKLSCMVIDVDEFKVVNDTYGHDVGDLVLQRVSVAIKQVLRAQDMVARTGGDEFIAICPDTPLPSALVGAERVRQAVEKVVVCSGMLRLKVSVSIGVAERDENMAGPEALIKRADQSLYLAKQRGRNRISAIQQSGPQGVVVSALKP